jgi:hypothetical protein
MEIQMMVGDKDIEFYVHLQKLTNLKESQANLKKEKNRKKK